MAPQVEPHKSAAGPKIEEAAGEPKGKAAAAPPSEEADAPPISRPPAAHGRRYKRREIGLTEGGKLILDPDGSIRQVDGEGATKEAWSPGDAEWARHAIRFGLRPQSLTVAPHGIVSRDARPQAG